MEQVSPVSDNRRFANWLHLSGCARALKKVAFALALITLIALIAVLIILNVFPFRYKWQAQEATVTFIRWMSAIVVLCLINVLVEVPSWLKTIADISFTWGIISCLISFMNEFPHYEWCYEWGKTTPVYPQCVQWRLIVTILMGIASGFAIILGGVFVLLLLHRVYVVTKSQVWRNSDAFTLRTGETSWTISFKFTRIDSEGVVQEARAAPTGQGPVHI